MKKERFEPLYDREDEEIGAPWSAWLVIDYGDLPMDVRLDPKFPTLEACQEFIDAVHEALGLADPACGGPVHGDET